MIQLSSRLFHAISAIVVVGAIGFAFQTKAQSAQQLADQTTAITTQVHATSSALGATAQAQLRETATIALGSAVRQTATAQFTLQGTQISGQVRATAKAEQKAREVRMYVTQAFAQATEQARNRIVQQTQVANTVRQTVLAIPTATPIPTSTPLPMPTPARPKINVLMEGCATGFDAILRRVGEVTYAYVTVQNVGEVDVSAVVVKLKANDESSEHPDQSKFFQYLPVGHQVTVDLAVGTSLFENTGITVIVTTKETVFEKTSRSDCKEIDPGSLEALTRVARLIVPIPRLPIRR